MANLIITVIAIVLVAVASLMGAYYGGQAFLSGGDAARATALVNQASQIAGAYDLYSVREFEAPYGFQGVSGSLIGDQYISEIPTPPDGVVPAGLTGDFSRWTWVQLGTITTAADDTTVNQTSQNMGIAMRIQEAVCRETNKNVGINAEDTNPGAPIVGIDATSDLQNVRYACFCNGCTVEAAAGPTQGNITAAGPLYFVYRIR